MKGRLQGRGRPWEEPEPWGGTQNSSPASAPGMGWLAPCGIGLEVSLLLLGICGDSTLFLCTKSPKG